MAEMAKMTMRAALQAGSYSGDKRALQRFAGVAEDPPPPGTMVQTPAAPSPAVGATADATSDAERSRRLRRRTPGSLAIIGGPDAADEVLGGD